MNGRAERCCLGLALLAGLACGPPPSQIGRLSRNVDYACSANPDLRLAQPTLAVTTGPHLRRRPATLRPASDLPPATTGRVLMVSVDGLRPDAIFHAPAKNLLELACRGAYTWQAETITPSLTVPAHASMVSGYLPDEHGIFHDDLRPGFLDTPTVMALARGAGKRVVMIVGKDKLVQLDPPGSTDVYVQAYSDDEVVNQAVLQAGGGFDLMFVHLPLVDLTGHAAGWMSPPYLAQVAAADAALGRLLQAVGPEATVIVSADHGGYDFVHWSGAPEDWQIPWIIAGPGIRAGHNLTTTVSTVDTAATAASVLGLTLDDAATGQPVDEAFNR